jgi:hypothetical protein
LSISVIYICKIDILREGQNIEHFSLSFFLSADFDSSFFSSVST